MIRHRTVDVDGLPIHYREAGTPGNPVLLLLHGFPASSFMFRDLMPLLADRFHLVVPDYPGFGHSALPDGFDFTFEGLTDAVEAFTERLDLPSFGLYLQDFGGPVGFRLATRKPERVEFLVVQNANAYEEGLPDGFWATPRQVWADPSPANRTALREAAMNDQVLEWNYTHGTVDPSAISPDSWVLQKALLDRPGNRDAMLDLLVDYRSNPPLYPQWQAYLRAHRPPTLIVWGRNDEIFPASGARAYLRDLPDAELHLLDTGHFALEDHADVIAEHIRRFAAQPISSTR
ncbi:alpha/beta fold hydrolase [Pseudonocardia sp. CA-107938]|uniref:alpha/beta fold hydrolase n=1 Tax=Pseudonocardia sp. CA-107938 TaxID=3240021 RepID=UPI003D8BB95B